MTGSWLVDAALPGLWLGRGACREVATAVFFPGRGASTKPAKAICRSCPVVEECREYALGIPQLTGIWGGLSEADRKRIRADLKASPPTAVSAEDSARTRRTGLYRTLEALTASPGRWARVAWYPGPHTATSMVARLRVGRVAAPEGLWRFESGAVDGGSGLWARYEGAERQAAATAG